MTPSLERAIQALKKLPSIGEKGAWRMALFLLENDDSITTEIIDSLAAIKQKVKSCSICHTWSEENVCPICRSSQRDTKTICVVETSRDMWVLEQSGRFNGLYHVLGGLLSPINGVTAEQLNINSLLNRVKNGETEEVIVGFGGSNEAETTSLYISHLLKEFPVVVSRFARGIASGMELEYADTFTLDQAINDRKIISLERD